MRSGPEVADRFFEGNAHSLRDITLVLEINQCCCQSLYASFLLARLLMEKRVISCTSGVPPNALATMGGSMYV